MKEKNKFLWALRVLLVLAFLTASLSSPNQFVLAGPAAGVQNEAISLKRFGLLSENEGWVLLNNKLYWTLDGAQTWEEMASPVPALAKVEDVFFLDVNTARMVWTVANGEIIRYSLAKTTDGGLHWEISPLNLFANADVASYPQKVDMGWLDAQNGWLAIKQGSSSNFSIGVLFTTRDGGNTWEKSTLPVADDVGFSTSMEYGWAVGGAMGNAAFRTMDGGKSWQDVAPAAESAAGVTVFPPVSSSGVNNLLVFSRTVGTESNLFIDDMPLGEGELTALANASLPGATSRVVLSGFGAQNFMATVPSSRVIFHFLAGHLQQIENTDGLSASITGLDALSAQVAWAKSVDASCKTEAAADGISQTTSCQKTTRLLATADGGVTWRVVNLPNDVVLSQSYPATTSKSQQNKFSIQSVTSTYIGQGFDICEIPSLSQLQTWRNASPYGAVNLYIGGVSRGCSNSALTASYVSQIGQQGWKLIPTWVGPQAPCSGFWNRISYDVNTAYSEGVNNANAAADTLTNLGLAGAVVYYDIEAYGTDTACRNATKAFINGWVAQLHVRGVMKAGVYGSTLCNTGLSDFRTISNVPDAIWFASWYYNAGSGGYVPDASVWDNTGCIPADAWVNHQRLHQYGGDNTETWGGVSLVIDENVLDGPVADTSAAPPYQDQGSLVFGTTYERTPAGTQHRWKLTATSGNAPLLFDVRPVSGGLTYSLKLTDANGKILVDTHSSADGRGILALDNVGNGDYYVHIIPDANSTGIYSITAWANSIPMIKFDWGEQTSYSNIRRWQSSLGATPLNFYVAFNRTAGNLEITWSLKRRSDGAVLSTGSSTNGRVIAPGYASGYVDFYINSVSGDGSYRIGIYQGIPLPEKPGITNPVVGALVPNNFNVQIKPGLSNGLGLPKWHIQIDNDPNFGSPAYDNANAWSAVATINVNLPLTGKYWIRARQGDANGNTSDFTAPIYFYAGANICAKVTEIPIAECDALAALYSSTNGANWTNKTGWMQTATPCSWYGVTCAAGHVTEVALTGNLLIGTIPAVLGNLPYLTRLLLNTNQLSGSIPTSLGNLHQLIELRLGGNQLTGNIPVELGNLSNLTILGLRINQLSGNIPTSFGNLVKLVELALNNNKLTGSIPSNIGNLTQLTRLELTGNQLSGTIPPSLGNLSQLLYLGLGTNKLSGGIPAQLGNLSQLTVLGLDTNQLSGNIPSGLGNLSHLNELWLDRNLLTGSLPSQLGNLSTLKYLYLHENQLKGEIPLSIVNLKNLTNLSLSCGLDSSNPLVISFINKLIPGWQNNLCLPVATLTSNATEDGFVLEATETSNVGGLLNSTAATFNLGDDATKKQYRGILSFSTGTLPDNAVITNIKLKVQKSAIVGVGNPVTAFQGFIVDIRNGIFGTAALQLTDFQAAVLKSYGPFVPVPVSNWYTLDLTTAKAYINKLTTSAGLTQIRLRFKLDDDNNAVANYLSLYSGNAPVVANRPQLVITYYVP